MGTDDAGVRAAARAIRPYLTELVGSAADRLDQHLADLLNRAPGEPGAVVALRTLLEEQKETTGWFLAEVLADAPHYRPPYQQPRYLHRQRRIPFPAGDPTTPIPAPCYICPYGDYDWYQPEVGTPIPHCPTHQVWLTHP